MSLQQLNYGKWWPLAALGLSWKAGGHSLIKMTSRRDAGREETSPFLPLGVTRPYLFTLLPSSPLCSYCPVGDFMAANEVGGRQVAQNCVKKELCGRAREAGKAASRRTTGGLPQGRGGPSWAWELLIEAVSHQVSPRPRQGGRDRSGITPGQRCGGEDEVPDTPTA